MRAYELGPSFSGARYVIQQEAQRKRRLVADHLQSKRLYPGDEISTWKEEEMLVQHFGSEYILYRSQTGRFLPRIVFAPLGVKLLAVRNT